MNHMVLQARVKQAGAIAILRRQPIHSVLSVVDALMAGGITAIEVTFDSEGAQELIQSLRRTFGQDLFIGAGTLMTPAQVRQAVEAGADVLLSPHLDVTLVETAASLGAVMIPGIVTPTEIVQATRAGADTLKLFPAGPLGPAYLKDLLGPFHGTSFIPTGGITVDNAADFLRAGAIGVGMGSALVPKHEVEAGDWSSITRRASELMRRIREVQSGVQQETAEKRR
ncbi:bifunctional 4-hydroxy-2-oxoglutarate aldolase/2-dehydro-3-deoxy-phosphogluconate aldolase [Alicyclobacillus pomorum]|jgi:2-dehydro-3-deoxyphosphogluconate aldolase/(4S)-4-hydroxy-2-oxoglutarate aldolase|uniref:bifunctional 4-hydroxy-2-oxoglutarate aldolase/2-dehydro-3-deoxy-phosphogluconate aldolase n=1 Tax=Alicyclobacillus pomorum TaxID=204470 RepID=UPI000405D497|nr:bifunctional 4-hydroxy-2-oxoglutarate aldolase/2-dehydro-3-deoxy-phosphogluconate aldolase [Alicyclobacillus pomorum]